MQFTKTLNTESIKIGTGFYNVEVVNNIQKSKQKKYHKSSIFKNQNTVKQN